MERDPMSLKLAALFTDHAVLQQGMVVPIWGWAPPNTMVEASAGAYSAMVKSGHDGRFRIELPPMPAGGPFQLSVSCPGHEVIVRDVWVGEVWLASGQSNMAWTLESCGLGETAVPGIRMITVDRVARIGVRSDFSGSWKTASGQDLAGFSAVAFHFARRLHAELGTAVGIVNSSWGGTVAEAWTSRETLARNPDYADWMHRYHATINTRGYWDRVGLPLVPNYPADPGNAGVTSGWAEPEFDDGGWDEMNLPASWQATGHNFSGVFWFRKEVDLPPRWAGRDILLDIGAVDKQDITYFNGEKVGAMGQEFQVKFWNINRSYLIPGKLVKAGRNVIAVRAYSFVFAGGLIGPADRMKVSPVNDTATALPLAGGWRFQVEHNFGVVIPPPPTPGEGCPNSPHILFDNMIAPLVPYALRGVIWYQGESNTAAADRYRHLLVEMIRCWRYAWGQGNFPFIQVQLANFIAVPLQKCSTWALLREAQLQVTREPEVGMAVAIDTGEPYNIHPRNKHDVGYRLAQWALARTYGRAIVPAGPVYSRMTLEGDRLRLHFNHADAGLVARDGALKTFYIAGTDRHFVEAEATIEGATVVVNSGRVREPVAARYAWADNPAGCNLYNSEGFPASPFRTDTWGGG